MIGVASPAGAQRAPFAAPLPSAGAKKTRSLSSSIKNVLSIWLSLDQGGHDHRCSKYHLAFDLLWGIDRYRTCRETRVEG